MSINKLIANDIINYGMNNTLSDNYIVSLDSYLDDFDEESQEYIQNNLEDIISDIHANENVCDLIYDKKEKEFNMIFYWDNLLDVVDHFVMKLLKEKNMEEKVQIHEVKEIAQEVMNDDGTINLALEKIKNYNMEYEL